MRGGLKRIDYFQLKIETLSSAGGGSIVISQFSIESELKHGKNSYLPRFF